MRVRNPKENLQIKMLRALLGGSEFVAHLDALGEIDGRDCLIDWKTTTSRYSTEPEGLLSLDQQLICYSWISGIPEVALVVFVRKHAPEIQYLRASISEEQRQEFGRLVETTIGQIEGTQFVSHTGIRFPQNGCLSCPHLGLCLNNEELVTANLIRDQERTILIGLTSLWIKGRTVVEPELNRRRALEKDAWFVELGEYLCEVRAKQYWRLERLASFDDFLAKRFPDSRRKAYYLMTIHEHLMRVPKPQLREIGWTKARELVKVARRDGPEFACAPWVALHVCNSIRVTKATYEPIADERMGHSKPGGT